MTPKPDQSDALEQSVARHYDVGNDFYALWLDPSMSYSCALWKESDADDDLYRAQLRKLDYFLGAVGQGNSPGRVAPRHLLDVGCGWGALLERAIVSHGYETAVGLTISSQQFDYRKDLAPSSAQARLERWQDHVPVRPYDAIISVAALEAFASAELDAAERLAVYKQFFAQAWEWSLPGARLGLQTIVNDQSSLKGNQLETRIGRFLAGEVFGGSALPRATEVLTAADSHFSLDAMRIDGGHYGRTCAVWRKRLRSVESEARLVGGDEIVDFFLRYLAVAQKTFDFRWCNLVRLTFSRRNRPLT